MDAQTRAGTIKVLERIRDGLDDVIHRQKGDWESDSMGRTWREGFEAGLSEALLIAQVAMVAARREGIPFSEPTIMGPHKAPYQPGRVLSYEVNWPGFADGILYQIDNQREQMLGWTISEIDPDRRQYAFSMGRVRALELIVMYAVKDNIRSLELGLK